MTRYVKIAVEQSVAVRPVRFLLCPRAPKARHRLRLPIFAMQNAISFKPMLTLAAITAIGPLFVFLLQIVEGRFTDDPATMTGLMICFSGAIIATYGGARCSEGKAERP